MDSSRLLIVGRSNRKKSNHPIDLMVKRFSVDGYQIEWFKSKAVRGIDERIRWQTTFRDTQVGTFLCQWRPLKGLLLELIKWVFWSCHPKYLWHRLVSHENNQAIANELIQTLQQHNQSTSSTILLCQSAGGIQGSLASLSGGVHQLVCFGYPFQHPDKTPEAHRIQHLADIKTPMLILQGNRDPYGNYNLNKRYHLSPAITVELLAADHDYALSEREASRAYQLIQQFLGTPIEPADHPTIPANHT